VNAPEGFTVRPAGTADAPAVAELMNAHDGAYLEEPDTIDGPEIEGWWARIDLEQDTRLCFDAAGRLAAAATVDDHRPEVLELNAFTHPAYTGHGLGTAMIAWLENEAASRDRRPRTSTLAADRGAAELVDGLGYRAVRHFYRMAIDLDGPPPEPVWPAGFTVSTMRAGEERAVHAVVEETFAEHWGHAERTFEEWSASNVERPWWDPSLVYLVREGDEIAAVEINAHRFGDGLVGVLGPRKAWRGRGLGRALLLKAFGDLHRRGERRVALAVDAGNETGATHLYESVGMRVVCQWDVYEKHL
jgi:mycothiol synthase